MILAQVPIGPELIVIVAIIVLLFGSSKIPKLARSVGEATTQFKRGRDEGGDILDSDSDSDSDNESEDDIDK